MQIDPSSNSQTVVIVLMKHGDTYVVIDEASASSETAKAFIDNAAAYATCIDETVEKYADDVPDAPLLIPVEREFVASRVHDSQRLEPRASRQDLRPAQKSSTYG